VHHWLLYCSGSPREGHPLISHLREYHDVPVSTETLMHGPVFHLVALCLSTASPFQPPFRKERVISRAPGVSLISWNLRSACSCLGHPSSHPARLGHAPSLILYVSHHFCSFLSAMLYLLCARPLIFVWRDPPRCVSGTVLRCTAQSLIEQTNKFRPRSES
jgi:hypothetical protein